MPLTLIILLLVFGALVAAGLPLLLALTAVIATIGLVALPSHLVPMDPNVSAVVLLVGLAVGVDYSLFYLKREREERAAGKSTRAALEAAAATSGRSVLISGLTVMVAMAGMLFSRRQDVPLVRDRDDDRRRRRDARLADRPAGAALAARRQGREGPDPVHRPAPPRARREPRLGDGPDPGPAPPARHRRRRRPPCSSRSPCRCCTSTPPRPGLDALPKSIATVPTLDRIQTAFPGGADPALVAIKADTDAPATKTAIAALKTKALATGLMTGPIEVDVNPAHTVARVAIPLAGQRHRLDVARGAPLRSATTSCRRRSGRFPARPTRSPAARPPRRTRTRC